MTEQEQQAERARELHGLTVPADSAMWPEIAGMQRADLIRLHWKTGKHAVLRYVGPPPSAPDERAE